MTPIRFSTKPRWRESGAASIWKSSYRTICVALEPDAVILRLKGTRQVVRLPLRLAYQKACWLEAGRIRLEKINARRARKAGKVAA